jgi:hypothetical protein
MRLRFTYSVADYSPVSITNTEYDAGDFASRHCELPCDRQQSDRFLLIQMFDRLEVPQLRGSDRIVHLDRQPRELLW